MKKLLFLIALAAGICASSTLNAQAGGSVNISLQPIWGPVGYDHVDYYYIPDIDAYYYIAGRVFIYMDGGKWVRTPALPPRYANFDLYHAYKIVLNEHKPWLRHEAIKARYGSYRGQHDQLAIRDSHDPKYYQIKDHPQHSQWHGDEHHGKQPHKGKH